MKTLILSITIIIAVIFKPTINDKPMKLVKDNTAPEFNTIDVYGKQVKLSDYRGKKILLSFFRTAGCPVCNVRFHELAKEEVYFKSKNLVFIAVYNSHKENLLNYLKYMYPKGQPYPLIIPDTAKTLYKLYDIDESTCKLMNGMLFHHGFSTMSQGKALFKKSEIKVEDDGSKTLVQSDFLINEDGKISVAHYGKYSGDFLAISAIKQFCDK